MNKNTVIEYADQLSEEELKWLALRLTERLSGDLGDALSFMSRNKSMDTIFAYARSAEDLYDKCDEVRDILQKECRKRGLILKGQAA